MKPCCTRYACSASGGSVGGLQHDLRQCANLLQCCARGSCVEHSKLLIGQQQQVGLNAWQASARQSPSQFCLLLLPCAVAAVAMQGKLEELEQEIMEVNGNSERLARSYNELVELQLVLERAGSFFDQVHTPWDTHVERLPVVPCSWL